MVMRDVPVTTPEADALAVSGIIRNDRTLVTTNRLIYFVTSAGEGGTVGIAFETIAGGIGGVPSISTLTLPTLALPDDVGGPTTGRAMRCCVDLVSTTQVLNRGGRVYVAMLDSRILLPGAPSTLTNAQWNATLETIIAYPTTVVYSGDDFALPRRFTCHPVNNTEYHTFESWQGTMSADRFAEHFGIWSGSNPLTRPMSTVCIIVDAPPIQQSYTATLSGRFYTRWPLNTVQSQIQKPIPVASPAVVNAAISAMKQSPQRSRDTYGRM